MIARGAALRSVASPLVVAPLLLALLPLAGCAKVPIHDVSAGFSLADAAWFAEEQTLFVFYEVSADQGLGEPSVIELTYRTDAATVDWTPIEEFPTIHTHLPVDCGADSLCGSTSLHVPLEPRDVGVRLRYHRDGELALDAETIYDVVGPGDPWSHRSYLAYGVFNEANERVQWRGRHRFPTLRNEEAQEMGLRRALVVDEQRFGTAELANTNNPYGYGASCPEVFADAAQELVSTVERAVFNATDLPQDATTESVVCAQATVTDATGTFTTGAIARKNPEVRPAFPVLHSPIRDATPVPFYLSPCDRTISELHEAMQRQRLQMTNVPTTCIEDWSADGFEDRLIAMFTDAVEAQRAAGDDMVLVIGLQRDEEGPDDLLEAALAEILPAERHRTSPRLAGAFVFDSFSHEVALSEVSQTTLWCPSTISFDFDTAVTNLSSIACAVAPDDTDIELGPFTFGALPILPTREQYLEFIQTYSTVQAGEVLELSFLTPEFATTSEHVDIGDYGVVTFLNGELISAEPDDAFSICTGGDLSLVAFRSDVTQSEKFAKIIEEACEGYELHQDVCDAADVGLMPIEWLADWHNGFLEDTYELGLFWDFPFLLRMEYEVYAAGSVSAFGLSVPFGVGESGESYLGTTLWTSDEVSLEELLTQCTRFCDNPTFDSAGVYHVLDPFRDTYANVCYVPVFPVVGDSGFPSDP